MQGSGFLNGGLRENTVGDNSALPINVQTVLNIKQDSLNYWQNLTCFFNRWWYPEPDRITLPYCFFHIIKYTERDMLEIGEKRMILYEPPEEGVAADEKSPVRSGLMQTIADNIVIRPKEYELEVIVPFMPFGRYVKQGIETAKLFTETLGVFGGVQGGISADSVAYITDQLASVNGYNGYAQVANSAFTFQDDVITPESSGIISSDNQVNKNSLDAMFNQGVILEFKTWMGFDYKYVIITEKTAEKRPDEDDVWRVHLTLKEVPILTLAPKKGEVSSASKPWLTTAIDYYGNVAGYPASSNNVDYYKLTGTTQ